MLEIALPGTEVILANYPPPLPKRLLSKAVPVVQVGVISVVIGGEQIFPMLGFIATPPWYYSLRSNRFGTIASAWLLGNALQSFLQSTGAFEVYFNGELVSDVLLSFTLYVNSSLWVEPLIFLQWIQNFVMLCDSFRSTHNHNWMCLAWLFFINIFLPLHFIFWLLNIHMDSI